MSLFYNKVDKKLIAEGVRILYLQPMNVSLVQLLIALTIFGCTYATVSAVNYVWLFVLVSIYLLRLFMIKRFNLVQRSDLEAHKWGRYFSYTALVTGTCWGLSVFIFTSTYSITLAVLCFLVILISLGSIIATSYWLEGFYSFIFPAILLVTLKLFLAGEIVFVSIGFALILFLSGLCIYGKINNKLILDTINYKFQNLDIIDQLERVNNSKARFFASANHDLRQPINSLGLIANSLASEPQTKRSESLLENLGVTLERLDHLLDSLLEISTIESGSMKYNLKSCSLDSIFRTILVEHLDTCREKNLELRIRPSEHSVISDEFALGRILSNLVNNAVKYTDKGGILVGCRTHWDNHICIEVWDTGIGIDGDELEQVFDEFYQIDNQARQTTDGLGLGLSICRRLADQLGHELVIRSRPGKGTVVGLLLEKAAPETSALKSPISIAPRWKQNGKKILLVEDDDMGRNILADLLRQQGAIVTTASDVKSALEASSSTTEKIDLIISDYRLPPPLNGIELIDEIRTTLQQENLNAILVSGDMAPNLEESNTSGEIRFISKPINIDFLINTMQQLTELSEQA